MRVLLAALGTVLFAALACASQLPDGYAAIPSESWGEAESWRSDSPSGFLRAEGDFNGDGEQDEVVIARRTSASKRYLLLREGPSDAGSDWIVLQEVSAAEGVTSLGPRRHTLYCVGDLEPDQLCTVDLQYDSINLFVHDAAHQVFFWDADLQRYRSLWGSI